MDRVDPMRFVCRAWAARHAVPAPRCRSGKPPLDVALDSRWQWWKHDHALVVVLFDAADRGRFDPAVTYCFELERATTQRSWCASEPLPVPPRPLGNEHRAR